MKPSATVRRFQEAGLEMLRVARHARPSPGECVAHFGDAPPSDLGRMVMAPTAPTLFRRIGLLHKGGRRSGQPSTWRGPAALSVHQPRVGDRPTLEATPCRRGRPKEVAR